MSGFAWLDGIFFLLCFVGRGDNGNIVHSIPCFFYYWCFGEKDFTISHWKKNPLKIRVPLWIIFHWRGFSMFGINTNIMGSNWTKLSNFKCISLRSWQRVGHPAHLCCISAEAAFLGPKLLFQPRCQNRKALAGQAMRSSKVSGWRITEPPSSFSRNIKHWSGACMLADGFIFPAIWAQSCPQHIQTQFSPFLPLW